MSSVFGAQNHAGLLRLGATLCMATMVLASSCSVAVGAQIRWHVENPFRLFLDPADTQLHRATLEALTLDERLRPILSSERRLSEARPRGWAENAYQKLC